MVSIAQGLFEEHGYEGTTTELIASAAGMSRRSFFRYFASKEELVLGKYALLGDVLREALRSRPDEEPLWAALRHMFEAVAPDDQHSASPHIIERIIEETPSLRAGYLYRIEAIQGAIAAEARVRAERAGSPYGLDDPAPEAVVGAAFACMIAARRASTRSNRSWPETVALAMEAVRGLPTTSRAP